MKKKKRYTSEEKTMILREHLETHVPISDLADKYGVHPNAIYKWKKSMYENAADQMAAKNKQQDKQVSALEARIKKLEATLAMRDSVIAELAAENIDLKKNSDGADLLFAGWNPKSGRK